MWRRSRSPAGPPRRAWTFSVVAPSGSLFSSHIECSRSLRAGARAGALPPARMLALLSAANDRLRARPPPEPRCEACSRVGSGAERRACPQVPHRPDQLASVSEETTMLIGYARTSTLEQEAGLEAQFQDLQALVCEKVIKEQTSSVGPRRGLGEAMEFARSGDRLAVTKLDKRPAASRTCGRSSVASRRRTLR